MFCAGLIDRLELELEQIRQCEGPSTQPSASARTIDVSVRAIKA
jgi:hypothetical protein